MVVMMMKIEGTLKKMMGIHINNIIEKCKYVGLGVN